MPANDSGGEWWDHVGWTLKQCVKRGAVGHTDRHKRGRSACCDCAAELRREVRMQSCSLGAAAGSILNITDC